MATNKTTKAQASKTPKPKTKAKAKAKPKTKAKAKAKAKPKKSAAQLAAQKERDKKTRLLARRRAQHQVKQIDLEIPKEVADRLVDKIQNNTLAIPGNGNGDGYAGVLRRPMGNVPKLADPAIKNKFIEGMALTGTVKGAAAHAGEVVTYYYVWTNPNFDKGKFLQHYDEDFCLVIEEARELYRDMVRSEIDRRGIHGVEKPVFGSGGRHAGTEIVGHVTEYSDKLLELRAKMSLPEARDIGSAKVSVNNNTNLTDRTLTADKFNPLTMTPHQRDLYRQLIESLKATADEAIEDGVIIDPVVKTD